MTTENCQLPWYSTLLGTSPDSSVFERFVREFELTEDTSFMDRHFEGEAFGVSVTVRGGEVWAIQLMSDDVEEFNGFAGQLPLGLKFSHVRADVLGLLGRPDHEMGARHPDRSYGHAGIYRYDLGTCWVAVSFSVGSDRIQQVGLESRKCAARFVGTAAR